MNKEPLIGFCPIGKFVFSHEDAMRLKALVRAKLDEGKSVTWTWRALCPTAWCATRSMLTGGAILSATAYRRPVSPPLQFGTEGAAAMIAKECGVPTLLWGRATRRRWRTAPPARLALRHAGHQRSVPHPAIRFSYINNCRVEDDEFRRGLNRFVGAARVVKRLRSMRIGQVGQRIDFFWSTITNEGDLLQRFGIQVVPIDLADMCRTIRRRTEANRAAYREELAAAKEWICFNHYREEEEILHNFRCGTSCWKPPKKTTWTVSASRPSVRFRMSSILSSTTGAA